MDWRTVWFEWLDRRSERWLLYQASRCGCTVDRFESCLARFDIELADRGGLAPGKCEWLILNHPDRPWEVEYVGRGGRTFVCELRWWCVRRICEYVKQERREGETGEDREIAGGGKLEVAGDIRMPRPAATPVSPCTAIRETLRLAAPCLNRLSDLHRRAVFYSARFLDEHERDPVIDAIPDECASVLGDFGLSDDALLGWFAEYRSRPAIRALHRTRARQSLENCMISQHGPDWRDDLL